MPAPLATPSRRRARAASALLALCALLPQGCATIAGIATGALTGLIDGPAQVYRSNRGEFERHPELWPFNIIIISPVALVFGPIAGLAKGIALDMEWFLGHVDYDKVFGSYLDESVWRPYTIHW